MTACPAQQFYRYVLDENQKFIGVLKMRDVLFE